MYQLWDDWICCTAFTVSKGIPCRSESPSSIRCNRESKIRYTSLSFRYLCKSKTPLMVAISIFTTKHRKARYGKVLYSIQESCKDSLRPDSRAYDTNECTRLDKIIRDFSYIISKAKLHSFRYITKNHYFIQYSVYESN